MKFLPEFDTTIGGRTLIRSRGVVFLAASYLAGTLPVLAEKIEDIAGPKAPAPNQTLLSLFTVLNYIAGFAILAALVLCGVWFFQRKDEADALDSEAAAAAAAASATPVQASAESAAEASEKTSPEGKSESEK